MSYELWNGTPGNRVGQFDTLDEALRAVAETAAQFSPRSQAVRELWLRDTGALPGKGLIAEGQELVRLAIGSSRVPKSRSSHRRRRAA